MLNLNLKETRNSFRHLNLSWISNKTIMRVGNITKAATFESFFHVSLTACFNELKEVKYFKKIKNIEESPSKSRCIFRTQSSIYDEDFFVWKYNQKVTIFVKKNSIINVRLDSLRWR